MFYWIPGKVFGCSFRRPYQHPNYFSTRSKRSSLFLHSDRSSEVMDNRLNWVKFPFLSCLNTQFVLHGSWQAAPLISAADAFLHSRLRWTFHRVQIPLKNPCAVKACAVSWAFRKGSVSNLSSLLWFFGEVQVKLLSPPDHFKEYFVVQIPFHSYLGQPDLEKTLWRDLMFRCREHDLPFLSSHLNTMYN